MSSPQVFADSLRECATTSPRALLRVREYVTASPRAWQAAIDADVVDDVEDEVVEYFFFGLSISFELVEQFL
jgi:hypothetical protein